VLNFRDNGKGVPQDKKKWIFLPLKTTESKQGSGLGLYIIQKTLKEMGGFILENGTKGANFLIYIPYKGTEAN
jgi:C4-dicarboxylate-specific signal transduction histidine kinase